MIPHYCIVSSGLLLFTPFDILSGFHRIHNPSLARPVGFLKDGVRPLELPPKPILAQSHGIYPDTPRPSFGTKLTGRTTRMWLGFPFLDPLNSGHKYLRLSFFLDCTE